MKFLAFFLTIGLLVTGLSAGNSGDGVSIVPDHNGELAVNPCNPRIKKCS